MTLINKDNNNNKKNICNPLSIYFIIAMSQMTSPQLCDILVLIEQE